MTKHIEQLTFREQLNFLVTNRVPRKMLTQFMGWYSKIESPWLTKISIKLWALFSEDLKLEDAKETSFKSLQACFTRELKDNLRPIEKDESLVASPCDAIIGAYGKIEGDRVFQAKGFPYALSDLIPDYHVNRKYRDGYFVTLRLKSSMYHRFHAPINCKVKKVTYISGDTWNVNPIALKRVEKLYCKNERAVIELCTKEQDSSITLVPVAAILVACMKFTFLHKLLDLKYRGPNTIDCKATFKKGDEMGHFQHGSTIILFATNNYQLCEGLSTGTRVNMGQALLTGHPNSTTH